MKPGLLFQSVAILAATTLLTLSSAQAGMGACLLGSGNSSPACANPQVTQPACSREDSAQAAPCVISNAQLGSMAAGGLQIATNVMRVLLDKANMIVGPSPDK